MDLTRFPEGCSKVSRGILQGFPRDLARFPEGCSKVSRGM